MSSLYCIWLVLNKKCLKVPSDVDFKEILPQLKTVLKKVVVESVEEQKQGETVCE